MTVGVLALQGAFVEHEKVLSRLGVGFLELRDAHDLDASFDRLILPGGESTVQGKLLFERGMLEPLRDRIASGMPVLGTCAGLILLAKSVSGGRTCLGTLPITVRRNGYGRQLASFHTHDMFDDLGDVPMTFIRAPYVSEVSEGVDVLARVDGRIVAVGYGNQMGTAFHPELDDDLGIHSRFMDL